MSSAAAKPEDISRIRLLVMCCKNEQAQKHHLPSAKFRLGPPSKENVTLSRTSCRQQTLNQRKESPRCAPDVASRQTHQVVLKLVCDIDVPVCSQVSDRLQQVRKFALFDCVVNTHDACNAKMSESATPSPGHSRSDIVSFADGRAVY